MKLDRSSRGTKKSQFLNSDEEKPVSREKSHSMGTFLAFLGDIGFSSSGSSMLAFFRTARRDMLANYRLRNTFNDTFYCTSLLMAFSLL